MAGLFDKLKGGAKPAPKAPATKEGAAPLADFADMFKKLQEAQVAAGTKKATGPDPKKLAEAISGARIAPQITAEQLAAITAGGEGALETFTTLLNQTAQASTLQAVLAAQRMLEVSQASTQQELAGALPQMVRDQQFQQQLLAAMPDLSNPAVSPLVEVVRSGIAASNPDATPEQLTQQALKYFQDFSGMVAPAPAAGSTDADVAPETDFFALLGINPAQAAGNADAAEGAGTTTS